MPKLLPLHTLRRQARKTLLLTPLVLASHAFAADLSIGGNVTPAVAGSYSLGALQALGGTVTHTIGGVQYEGISLWSLLGGTSGIVPVGTSSNAILRSFVSAVSTDGTQSLVSVGEIHTNFGGTGSPVIVAYARDGMALSAPMLVDAEDASGTRSLAKLASLTVQSAPQPTGGTGGTSTSFSVTGVGSPGSFDLAALQSPAFTTTTLNGISFNNGAAYSYTGVTLWSFLNTLGIDLDAAARGYVTITATDNVAEVFSFAELDPVSRGPQDVLIAYDRSEGGLGNTGFARMVVPGDVRGGRYLSNVASIEVAYVAAVPEPATWALLLAGVGVLAGAARRRQAAQPEAAAS